MQSSVSPAWVTVTQVQLLYGEPSRAQGNLPVVQFSGNLELNR